VQENGVRFFKHGRMLFAAGGLRLDIDQKIRIFLNATCRGGCFCGAAAGFLEWQIPNLSD
jgi:hypothetical protein